MTEAFALLEREGVLPVAVLERAEDAKPLAEALAAGGLGSIEVTLRTHAAEEALGILARESQLLVGAGTVLDAAQARRAIDAGARFVVSPGLDLELVRECRRLGIAHIPGVATPSEVQAAVKAGLDVMKLFPAKVLGGLEMVKALAAPFAGVRFLPTGGIGVADVAPYLAHPAVMAVGGSWLVSPELVSTRNWPEVTRLTAEAAATVAQARAEAA